MNRRGFIATLTALAGVALAKIKPPASDSLQTVTHLYWRRGAGCLSPGTVADCGTKLIRVLDYTYNNGLNTCTERWLPPAQVAKEMNADFDMVEKAFNGVVCRFHE